MALNLKPSSCLSLQSEAFTGRGHYEVLSSIHSVFLFSQPFFLLLSHVPIRGWCSGTRTTQCPVFNGSACMWDRLSLLLKCQESHSTGRLDYFFFLRFKVGCFNISLNYYRKPFIMEWKCLENGLLINVKWDSAPQSKGTWQLWGWCHYASTSWAGQLDGARS